MAAPPSASDNMVSFLMAQVRAEKESKAAAEKEKASRGPLLLEGPEGSQPPPPPEEPESSDSEDEAIAAAAAPAGPLDPDRCTVSGSGFAGGSAGTPMTMVITARDAAGRRIREGGAYVLVMLEPASPASSEVAPIEAAVTDHGDGTYSAAYTVPAKGNYEVRRGRAACSEEVSCPPG